ncbi:hypothetical protein KSP40_PGU021720 [Platanthera guangdongensis]|uniref:CMP/dCMP-type deaminase domain-containing protein n=1 Tax=Platanthera guangdongensis TaxID=2320717 RepID=A0ABR2MEF0_9ASPA
MFPCNECAKVIIQSGVSEVIYFVEKRVNNSDVAYSASHKLLSMAGVKVMSASLLSFFFFKYKAPYRKGSLGAQVEVFSCDLEVIGSSLGSSLLQKCRVRFADISPL